MSDYKTWDEGLNYVAQLMSCGKEAEPKLRNLDFEKMGATRRPCNSQYGGMHRGRRLCTVGANKAQFAVESGSWILVARMMDIFPLLDWDKNLFALACSLRHHDLVANWEKRRTISEDGWIRGIQNAFLSKDVKLIEWFENNMPIDNENLLENIRSMLYEEKYQVWASNFLEKVASRGTAANDTAAAAAVVPQQPTAAAAAAAQQPVDPQVNMPASVPALLDAPQPVSTQAEIVELLGQHEQKMKRKKDSEQENTSGVDKDQDQEKDNTLEVQVSHMSQESDEKPAIFLFRHFALVYGFCSMKFGVFDSNDFKHITTSSHSPFPPKCIGELEKKQIEQTLLDFIQSHELYGDQNWSIELSYKVVGEPIISLTRCYGFKMRKYVTDMDAYGNKRLYFQTRLCSESELREIIKAENVDESVALVMYGLEDNIVKQFNHHNRDIPNTQWVHFRGFASLSNPAVVHQHASCYVVYNNATCPKTFFGHVFSAFVCIIVKHEDELYLVTVKDKSKKMKTLPGGTAELQEVSANHVVDFCSLAIRETREETGIILQPKQMRLMACMKFKSTYLQIENITDYSQVYCVQASVANLGLQDLFTPACKFGDVYLRLFENHNEIESLWAEKISHTTKRKPESTSSIAWACAQAVLANTSCFATYGLDDLVFPPSLQYINFCYEPRVVMTPQKPLTFAAMQEAVKALKTGVFVLDPTDTLLCFMLLQQEREQEAIAYVHQRRYGLISSERDAVGFNPIHYAVANHRNQFLKACLYDFDFRLTSVHQLTALHVAILCKNEEALELLSSSPCSYSTIDIRPVSRDDMVHPCNVEAFRKLCTKVETVPLVPENQLLQERIVVALHLAEQRREAANQDILTHKKQNDSNEETEEKQNAAPQNMNATWSTLELNFGVTQFANRNIDVNYLVWVLATQDERDAIFDQVKQGNRCVCLTGGDQLRAMICDKVVFDDERVRKAYVK